jgi:CIC family chloride channel protein
LFVIEEVIGSWNSRVLGSIVLSAVSAVLVSRWFVGNEPLFRVPAFELRHPSEMLVYALMGIAGGILAAFFIKAVEWLRRLLARLPAHSRHVQPLIAGLLVGAMGLLLPEIMGAGYEAIDSALHSQFPWRLLLLLAAAKIIATLICTGAGIPGGMFAPTLFTGAMIGGGLGGLAQAYSPFPASSTGEYVLVGMGTFFAGVFRAPMTSVFMVFEVTASYVIILPVLVANTLAYMVSQRLQRSPFFEMVAREEGIELPSSEGQRELQPLRVEDAMEEPAIPVLGSGTPAGEALAACTNTGASYCLMFSERTDWFIAWRSALEDASRAGQTRPELVRVPRLHPDLSMDAALTAMNSHPCLPVVSRADSHRLLGILTLDGVHRAYNIRPAAPVATPKPVD